MIRVSIPSADTRQMQGVSKAGKPYNLFFQTAYFHLLDKSGNPLPYPEKSEIILDKDEVGNPKAYAPGEYVLHPASLYIDRQGSLAVAPKLAKSAK